MGKIRFWSSTEVDKFEKPLKDLMDRKISTRRVVLTFLIFCGVWSLVATFQVPYLTTLVRLTFYIALTCGCGLFVPNMRKWGGLKSSTKNSFELMRSGETLNNSLKFKKSRVNSPIGVGNDELFDSRSRQESLVSVSSLTTFNSDKDVEEEGRTRDSGYGSRAESEASDNEEKTPQKTASVPQEERKLAKLTGSANTQPIATDISKLTDDDIFTSILSGKTAPHSLEKTLGDHGRAVSLRRRFVGSSSGGSVDALPHKNYDYASVDGVCIENVIGYVPLPCGVAGPMQIDGRMIHLPMATTEGTLVASTSRGAKAINLSGGATTAATSEGMTRAPVARFPTAARAAEVKAWLEQPRQFKDMQATFSNTTRHGTLTELSVRIAGRSLFLRFKANTGEAMGMNICGRGVQKIMDMLKERDELSDMELVSLSGNMCTDKKASAINWLEGRGRSVVADVTMPASVVESTLKCSVSALVSLNASKNYIGSALAGTSAGGFNAHAANIVAAIFLATGQDAAQTVESSNCITIMDELADGSLHASVTMPSIEVGTLGGGTQLGPQSTMLQLLALEEHDKTGDWTSGEGPKASALARIIGAAVLAAELSLCAALTSGDLIKAHMKHNRQNNVKRTDAR